MTAVSFADWIEVERRRDGRTVYEEMLIEFEDGLLRLRSDWSERRQDFKRIAEYRVVEDPNAVGGRGFILHRDAEAVEKDPDHETHYAVLIGPLPHCECKGFQATEREGRICRHVAAMRRVIAEEAK